MRFGRLLVAARPRIRAVIIGRNPPASLSDKIRERGLNVTLTGFVDDIRPYVARKPRLRDPALGRQRHPHQGVRGDGDGTAGGFHLAGHRRTGCHGR